MEVNDIVQTRHYCRLGDQASVNVRHWRVTTKAGTGATLASFLTTLAGTGLHAAYRALINDQAEYVGTDAQIIFPTLGVPTQSTTGAGSGDTSGDALPTQTSGLLTIRTSLGGRKNRGRLYVPFPTETDNTSAGAPTSTYQLALADLAAIFAVSYIGVGAGGNTNDLQPVILHRSNMTTTAVTSVTASAKWATQRRRGKFGRPNTTPF